MSKRGPRKAGEDAPHLKLFNSNKILLDLEKKKLKT